MAHKEGTHPELAMALENMDVIYKPNKKNIRYRDDGGFAVYNNFANGEQVIITHDIEEKKVDIYFMKLWIEIIILMKPSD